MKSFVPIGLTAAALDAAASTDSFDWRQLAWAAASALVAAGLELLRRWLQQPPRGVQHGDSNQDPPT